MLFGPHKMQLCCTGSKTEQKKRAATLLQRCWLHQSPAMWTKKHWPSYKQLLRQFSIRSSFSKNALPQLVSLASCSTLNSCVQKKRVNWASHTKASLTFSETHPSKIKREKCHGIMQKKCFINRWNHRKIVIHFRKEVCDKLKNHSVILCFWRGLFYKS